jgi:hypothetical protein
LLPCTPARARHLFKSGKAMPIWNKPGRCCVQWCSEQDPENQPLMVGIDPGCRCEKFRVGETTETELHLIVGAPEYRKIALRRMRQARLWRYRAHVQNRRQRTPHIPPAMRICESGRPKQPACDAASPGHAVSPPDPGAMVLLVGLRHRDDARHGRPLFPRPTKEGLRPVLTDAQGFPQADTMKRSLEGY